MVRRQVGRPIGHGFARLWTASTAGNLGDGIVGIAIALLAAHLTRDPIAVSAVTALSLLPWLVFGLPAGVLVDRYDRRKLAMFVGTVRAAAIAVLVASAATGYASLWLLYIVVLIIGTSETVYDNAVVSMIPMIVADRDDLERANGRLQGAQLVADSFVGPPLAGVLFAIGAAAAFGVSAACYAVAILLLISLPGTYSARSTSRLKGHTDGQRRSSMLREIVDGLRYIHGHRLHRSMLGVMVMMGFTNAMVNGVLVLWALEVLGVSEVAFGLLTITMAVGSLVGSQIAARLVQWVGRGPALATAVLSLAGGCLLAATTTSPYLAGIGLAMFGGATLVWNVIAGALRQRLTPDHLLGRTIGVYRVVTWGVMPLGALVGGSIAAVADLRLPWLVSGLALAASGVWALNRLRDDLITDAIAAADADRSAKPS